MLLGTLEPDGELERLVGSFLSRYRLAHEPIPEPGGGSPEQGLAQLESGAFCMRHPWTRLNWLRQGQFALLFAAGLQVACSPQLAERLCGPQPFRLARLPLTGGDREAILTLLEAGHLLITDAA